MELCSSYAETFYDVEIVYAIQYNYMAYPLQIENSSTFYIFFKFKIYYGIIVVKIVGSRYFRGLQIILMAAYSISSEFCRIGFFAVYKNII